MAAIALERHLPGTAPTYNVRVKRAQAALESLVAQGLIYLSSPGVPDAGERTFKVYWCPRCEVQTETRHHLCRKGPPLIPQQDEYTTCEVIETVPRFKAPTEPGTPEGGEREDQARTAAFEAFGTATKRNSEDVALQEALNAYRETLQERERVLREVVEALRAVETLPDGYPVWTPSEAADFIERTFLQAPTEPSEDADG